MVTEDAAPKMPGLQTDLPGLFSTFARRMHRKFPIFASVPAKQASLAIWQLPIPIARRGTISLPASEVPMPQVPSTRPGRTCPNCNTFVPAGNPRCQSCRMEVKQMDTFAAAKKAALAKGKRGVSEEPRETPFFLRPGNIVAVVFL